MGRHNRRRKLRARKKQKATAVGVRSQRPSMGPPAPLQQDQIKALAPKFEAPPASLAKKFFRRGNR